MKNVSAIFLILLIASCSAIKQSKKKSASEQVLNKIERIENQLNRFQKEKKADFIKEVNEIVNLSEIKPIERHFSGSNFIVYIPTKDDINNWKKWYANNIDKFYFSPYEKCLIDMKIPEYERENIIFIRVSDNLIRNSLSPNMFELCNN